MWLLMYPARLAKAEPVISQLGSGFGFGATKQRFYRHNKI
jgi:hypothetical protein